MGDDHPWPPREQRHPRGGPARLSRRRAAPAADGARRRGRDGRHWPHRAAPRGAARPRGGRPGAAGSGGPGGRQDSERPLGERLRLPRCRGRFCGETLAVSILSASPPFKVFQWIFGAVLGF